MSILFPQVLKVAKQTYALPDGLGVALQLGLALKAVGQLIVVREVELSRLEMRVEEGKVRGLFSNLARSGYRYELINYDDIIS